MNEHRMGGRRDLRTGTNIRLAAWSLLSALATWPALAMENPMQDYDLHCGLAYSEEACGALVGRIEALEWLDREHRLALAKAMRLLDRSDDPGSATMRFCLQLHTILADHPDYADALADEATYCGSGDSDAGTALLTRALEVEPDNFNALFSLVFRDWFSGGNLGIDPVTLAGYREALYEASLKRAAWKLSNAPLDHASSAIWSDVRRAAMYIYDAALRSADTEAATAIQIRVRRDLGLDDLDFPSTRACDAEFHRSRPYLYPLCRGGQADHLAFVCNSMLVGSLDVEDVCATAVERLAEEASTAGQAVPDFVLAAIEHTTRDLREEACGSHRLQTMSEECYGREATETAMVARLRAVLENHGGRRSAEHRRVHAMGFLGDAERLDALRGVLRDDPDNDRARCDLARAVADRGDYAAAGRLLGPDGDPKCLMHGFTLLDRKDFLAKQAAWRESRSPGLTLQEKVRAAGLTQAN